MTERPHELQRMLVALSTDPTTTDAFYTLVGKGCDPLWLVLMVMSSVSPPRELRKTLVNNSAEFRIHARYTEKIARQLGRIAQKLQTAQATEGLRDFLPKGIPSGQFLQRQAKAVQSVVSALKRKARQFLTDDLPLLQLCGFVKTVTGKTHYPEIAALLTLASSSIGQRKSSKATQPDSISKKIRRLKAKLDARVFDRAYSYPKPLRISTSGNLRKGRVPTGQKTAH